jgi:hypothetical protein
MKPNKEAYQSFIINELNKGNVLYKDVMIVFLSKFKLSEPTFVTYWNLANEAYKEQQQAINSAKLEQRIESEKEAVKRDIISKHDALEILSKIVMGDLNANNDKRQSIETMAKIEGWFAPKEIETTDKTIQPLQFEIIKREDTTT